jgi:transcriptional regulator with XRE-family HTH domain
MANNPFLKQLRERNKLSQTELAELLNVSQARVSRYESGEEYPQLPAALGYYAVFGKVLPTCFADLYDSIEHTVLRKCAALERAIDGRSDHSSIAKRALLGRIVERAVNRKSA